MADLQKGLDAARRGDFATAKSELEPLAEQGNADAQYNLGLMYVRGDGVTKDPKKGIQWYRLAAKQGRAEAQNNLAFMYAEGEGVTQDFIRAHMWWSIAASQGLKQAIENQELVEKELTFSELEKSKNLVSKWLKNNLNDY